MDLKVGGSEGTLQHPNMVLWENDGTTEVKCVKRIDATTDVRIATFKLVVGNTYYVSVDNYVGLGFRGTFTLCIDNSISIADIDKDILARNLKFSIAQATGIESNLTDSWSVSSIDYDNDNDDDLFITDISGVNPNRLYANLGGGQFSLVTTGAIATDIAKSVSSSWADYDNDGDLDVVVANTSSKSCFFYVNNGDKTFSKNTSAEFTKNGGYYHHVSWVDVDNDGKLELFLANYLPTRFNELWKINSAGNWEIISTNLLSQIPGSSVGATWADFNKDRFQDLLLLNNEGGKNRMFKNTGNGQFVEVFNEVTNHGGKSVGSTWGDIDNDGDLDLFISNAGNVNNELYFNNNGVFLLVTSGSIVSDGGQSHGCSFADFDKDMDLDLFVANDKGEKFLYYNNGHGVFTRENSEWITTDFGNSFGVSITDIEGDGDLDLITSTHTNQRDYIFTSNNTVKKFQKIRLIGSASNKSAVGAKIRLKAAGIWQTREISSQNGLSGQNSYRQFFGLGTASIVDSIIVYWPSGNIQTLKNQAVNQNMAITELPGTEVSALVYMDANHNCTYDAGEKLLPNVKFSINNGAYTVYSNDLGKISIHLNPGNYSISYNSNDYTSTCSVPTTFTVSASAPIVNLQNFALSSKCLGTDLTVNAFTTIMRRGFKSSYGINVQNKGITTSNGVSLLTEFPSSMNVIDANIPWTSKQVIADKIIITWDLGTMNYLDTKSIVLNFILPTSVNVGDQLTSTFRISGTGSDCQPINDVQIDAQTVYGSVDPNDILANPVGVGDEHFIHGKDEITYKIRFQNVGNYPAEFVNIMDELPEGIDVQSISKISSSHRYELKMEGNKVQFYFPSINLADSTSNEEESHGFVQFTVSQERSVTKDKFFENSASIQFDYNEFIQTNKVYHTILRDDNSDNSAELILFPNPANEYSYARLSLDQDVNPEIKEITIYTLGGNILFKGEDINLTLLKLDVKLLSAGTYIVSALDIYGNKYSGNLIVSPY